MENGSIDELNLKISATTNKANKAIDGLISNITRLQSSLGGIDTKGLQKLSSGISMLSTGMRQMQNIKMPDYNRLVKGLKAFERVDGTKLSQLSSGIAPLANSIGILNNARFDNKNVTNFINAITRLSNSNIQNINTTNFALLGSNLAKLTSSLQNAKYVSSSTVQITNAIAKLAASGTNAQAASTALPLLGANLKAFINSVAGARTVSENVINMTTALGQLASAGARTAKTASNLGILAVELKKFLAVMSTAPQVSANTIQMTSALAQLASAGGKVSVGTTKASNGIKSYNHSAKSATKSTRSLASALGKLYASYWLIFRAFGVFGKAVEYASDLTEVQNVVDVTFADMSNKVDRYAKDSIKKFGMSELAFKQYASRFQAMGSAMGINKTLIGDANKYLEKQTNQYISASNSMADVSLNLTKLTADMASFYNVEQKLVAEDLEAIFTGQTRPLRTYGLDLTEATLKEWAMKNGMDANIDTMSQAEKTMLRYQYVLANTTQAQGDFARTVNTWANQVRILKEQFKQLGSIIGKGVIAAFKPMLQGLNIVLTKVIKFTEKVLNALGQIFGWKYEISNNGALQDDFESAAESADDLASGTGKAAKNAKELKSHLLAIDELNVVEPDTDTGGSGGSGSGSGGLGDYAADGAMGKFVKDDTLLEAYKSNIKTLEQLGSFLGDTLSKIIEGINWDSVYKKASNFGKGFAEFLNGLISPRLFKNLGKTIANSINTALNSLNTFAKTFKWDNLGKSIGQSVVAFFTNWDAGLTAQTMFNFADGIIISMTSALETINSENGFQRIGEKIGDFISNIDWAKLAIDLSKLANQIVISLTNTIKGLKPSTFNKIGQGIVDFICNVDWGSLVWNLAKFWYGFQDAISGAQSGFFTGIAQAIIDKIFGEGTFEKLLGDKLKPIQKIIGDAFLFFHSPIAFLIKNFKKIWKTIKYVFEGGSRIARTAWEAVSGWFEENIFNPLSQGFTKIYETVSYVFNHPIEAIKQAWGFICDWFKLNVTEPLSKKFGWLKDKLTGSFKSPTSSIKDTWARLKTWFNTEVIGPLRTKFDKLGLIISDSFKLAKNVVKGVWETVSKWFEDNVTNPIKDKFTLLKQNITLKLSNAWKEIKRVWTGAPKWFEDNVTSPLKEKFEWIKLKIGEKFSGAFTNVKKAWSNAPNWFRNNIINPLQNAWHNATLNISHFFTSLWSSIKQGVAPPMNAIITAVESAVNKMIRGVNKIIDGINSVIKGANKITKKDWSEISPINEISLGRITYATGGFTEDGLFFANHGELVGKFSNGKTAVANNEQIVAGISIGVEAAVNRALAPYLAQIAQNTRETADKNSSINIDGRTLASETLSRTRRNGYSFA